MATPFITLTTDWGNKDHYVASLKGAILKDCNNVHFIDISHFVSRHDIVQAAYIFKNGSKGFGSGTVHIIGIENSQIQLAPLIIVKHNDQHFIGPDSGFFSMVFLVKPADIVRIKAPIQLRKSNTSHILARTAAYLANGGDLYEVGEKIDSYEERMYPRPVFDGNYIRTTVIYIDHFGNAVLNLDLENFKKFGKNRTFTILLKRNEVFQQSLFYHYSEVDSGEAVAIVNNGDMIEIGIYNDNASLLIGIKSGDIIRMEFHDH